MRLILQIFATLFLASLALGAVLMLGIDFKRAHEILDMSAALPADMKDLISPKDADPWRFAAFLWMVVAPLSLLGIVMVWMQKRSLALVSAVALGLFALAAAYQQPAGNQTQTMTESIGTNVAIFGGIGIVILVLLHTQFRADANPLGRR